MKDILILIVGWILGTISTWVFARKGSADIADARDQVTTHTQDQVRELTAQLSALGKLTQYSLAQIKEADLESAAEFEKQTSEEFGRTKKVLDALPEKAKHGIDISMFDQTRPCRVCGKPSVPSGFGPDQGGSMVWYFQCPEHGRFPSGHMADMLD